MAVSVGMDPLLGSELEHAAERQGMTPSQFIAAVARTIGRKNPHELMPALQAEVPSRPYAAGKRVAALDQRDTTSAASAGLRRNRKVKHGAGSAR